MAKIFKLEVLDKTFYAETKEKVIQLTEKALLVKYNAEQDIFITTNGNILQFHVISELSCNSKLSKLEKKYVIEIFKRLGIPEYKYCNGSDSYEFELLNKHFEVFKINEFWNVFILEKELLWQSTSLKQLINKAIKAFD